MDGFKLRLDLVMPPAHRPVDVEDLEEEYEICDACGNAHCPDDECPDHVNNMRTGPIPDLVNGDPVVDSEYLKRTNNNAPRRKS